MDVIELKITNGPTKPDLQWAVAYPERHLHIHFDTSEEGLDVHLDEMQELADGTKFALAGHVTSGLLRGGRSGPSTISVRARA